MSLQPLADALSRLPGVTVESVSDPWSIWCVATSIDSLRAIGTALDGQDAITCAIVEHASPETEGVALRVSHWKRAHLLAENVAVILTKLGVSSD